MLYSRNDKLTITAKEDCIFYIAGAKYEGIGEPHFRKFDITLPIGDVHQIHGEGVGQREVMFTLAPQDSASKLICGLTWSGEGAWTSWPPHQHEKDLEEVYCYFDMPLPKFGFHISYLKSGRSGRHCNTYCTFWNNGTGTMWISSNSCKSWKPQRISVGISSISSRKQKI